MTNDQEIALAQAHRQIWENCTSRPFTTREAEFAKLVRNAALEEAKQLFSQPHQEYFGREAQDAIESLKEPTP